jgi:hypothetical protein
LSKEITSGCVLGIWTQHDDAALRTIQAVVCPFKTEEEGAKYREPYVNGETVLNAAKSLPGLVESAITSEGSIVESIISNLERPSPEMGYSQITMTSGIY